MFTNSVTIWDNRYHMTQEIQNLIIKHYSKLISDYLQVKKGKHEYFKNCKDLLGTEVRYIDKTVKKAPILNNLGGQSWKMFSW